MGNPTWHLRPLPVKEAFEKWLDVASQAFEGIHLTATFSTNLSPIHTSIEAWGQQLGQNPEVKKFFESVSDKSLPLKCTQFSLQEKNSQLKFEYTSSDDIAASIQVFRSEAVDLNRSLSFFKTLHKIFLLSSHSELLIEHFPIAQQEMLKSQYAAIEYLQAATSEIAQSNLNQSNMVSEFLIKSTAEFAERARQREEELAQDRKQFEEESAQTRRHLRDELSVRRRQFEEDLAAQKKEFEEQSKEKTADVEKREEELKRKNAEANARQNTVVRRELLTSITGHIQSQKDFALSSSIDEKRNSVRKTFKYSMGVSGLWILAVVAWFVITLLQRGEPKWYQYAPLSVGILHLVSTAMYYLRWTDSWAREHAQAEMSNKKLNADILRASWLAELFFEGKDKERLLPDMLLSRFSEGLFTGSTSSAPEHPSDQMVDLMKKLSSVKVSKEGVELTKSAAAEDKK